MPRIYTWEILDIIIIIPGPLKFFNELLAPQNNCFGVWPVSGSAILGHRTVAHGLFYQAHYQRALQRCEDGVLSRIGLRLPSKSQSASLGSEDAFMRDVLKRSGGERWLGEIIPQILKL